MVTVPGAGSAGVLGWATDMVLLVVWTDPRAGSVGVNNGAGSLLPAPSATVTADT
jgi:hypothetical protein